MLPEQFIAKWQANARSERAACQEHFIDLCHLLDEPTPNTDPDGAAYAFEKGATKAVGGDGWADVWRKGRFAWEYKGKHRDLDAAHRQPLQYAGALGNPPLLVVSDMARFVVRTNWTNAISERHEVLLPQLTDPAKRHLLKAVLSDPDRLRPATTREALTGKAAGEFAELAKRLRARGNDPQTVAHFVNRLVFCLFADDVGLLPAGLFEQMLAAAKRAPEDFAGYARALFAAMASRGGRVGFTPVQWFNGGLFDDDLALPLEKADVEILQNVAELDWAEIDPSILGTLFERGLDPDKRSQLGAHYTNREKIEKLIDPVIRRPLNAEWERTKAAIEAALVAPTPAYRARGRDDPRKLKAAQVLRGFLDRLRGFRVLDPACGSGNFLYLALQALKDLEHRVSVEAEALGLQREFPRIGPEAVLGIEINPYAAELARVSVWIGHIQWARRHGLPPPADPVLKSLETIQCRDALLTADGKRAEWPKANVIIGNPPFLGNKVMINILGPGYATRLRSAYRGRVPGEADLVCYWFDKAWTAVVEEEVRRVGLVATQSIRKGASRQVLDPIARSGAIYDAWGDEPWTIEGAAVRVSLVCFAKSDNEPIQLDGKMVPRVHADLSARSADLTTSVRLKENRGICFQGPVKVGAFDIPGEVAREWLQCPANPNGRPNADVIRPWINGQDITRRSSNTWIIDFGEMSEEEAAYYVQPFTWVTKHVKPEREKIAARRARTIGGDMARPFRGFGQLCLVANALLPRLGSRSTVYLFGVTRQHSRTAVFMRSHATTT